MDSVPSTPSSGYTRPNTGGSESVSQPDGWEARSICQKQDCGAPVYQSRLNPTRLCKRHEMEERHKRATAQKQAASTAAVPRVPKPIHKKKLYPVKPDTGTRTLKRKRPSYGKAGDNDVEMAMGSATNIPQDPSSRPTTQGPSNNLSHQEGSPVRWPPRPTVDTENTGFLIEASSSELGIINPM